MLRMLSLGFATVLAVGLCAAADQDPPPGKQPARELYSDPFYGRSALSLPTPTSAGNWHGTWIYVNRDIRFALWLSENEGAPIAKLRYLGVFVTPESFETDWTGSARYFVQDSMATFDFKLTATGPDEMEATWDWVLDLRGSTRTEHAKLRLYRTGDGRRLVMYFEEFERQVTSASKDSSLKTAQAWTFVKMSKRLVLWEELPL